MARRAIAFPIILLKSLPVLGVQQKADSKVGFSDSLPLYIYCPVRDCLTPPLP